MSMCHTYIDRFVAGIFDSDPRLLNHIQVGSSHSQGGVSTVCKEGNECIWVTNTTHAQTRRFSHWVVFKYDRLFFSMIKLKWPTAERSICLTCKNPTFSRENCINSGLRRYSWHGNSLFVIGQKSQIKRRTSWLLFYIHPWLWGWHSMNTSAACLHICTRCD